MGDVSGERAAAAGPPAAAAGAPAVATGAPATVAAPSAATAGAPAAAPPWARHGLLRPLLELLAVLAVLALVLRVLHVTLPMVYPDVLQGPFSLDDLGEAEQYAGFSPLVPFYRPQSLGARPVYVTVFRRPQPRVVVLWQGEHLLYLEQTRGGERPPVSPLARPVAGATEAVQWREGRTRHLVARRGGLWIELRSDLGERDLLRVLETLRPYEELL